MDEDWRNAFGILMCMEICDGAGAGICDGLPSTCSSSVYSQALIIVFHHSVEKFIYLLLFFLCVDQSTDELGNIFEDQTSICS